MCPFIWCVFNDTLRHYASIPACILASFRTQSPACIPGVYPRRVSSACILGVHPRCVSSVCTRHSSGTQSVLHLRSILTFGQILPRILEQVRCPRYPTFIPFLLLSFIDVREICYCIVYLFILCVFYDTVCL